MKRNSLFFYRLGDCVSVQAQRALASTNHSMPVQMKILFFEGENMCWNVVNRYAGRALKAEFNKQPPAKDTYLVKVYTDEAQ